MEWLLFLGILPLIFIGGSTSDEYEPAEPGDQGTASFGDDDPSDITLTEGRDLHLASDGRDRIDGDAGSDLIAGEQGRDTLSGNDGDDFLLGGRGDDEMSGNGGDDDLVGGAGDDTLSGGAGDDRLTGSTGADTIAGGAGNDLLVGVDAQPGNFVSNGLADTATDVSTAVTDLYNGTVTDAQIGRISDDLQSANADFSADLLTGGTGDDTLLGDLGDTLRGGAGADQFVAVIGPDGSEPVEIADFAPEEEALHLLVDGPATGMVTVMDRVDGLGADVQLDGQVVAVLRGLTAAAVAPESILLTNRLSV